MEKGKLINEDWKDGNILFSYINYYINIENNIKDINVINEKINNHNKSKEIKINFYPELRILSLILNDITKKRDYSEIDYF